MPTQALLFVDQVDSTRQLAEIGDDAMVAVRRRLQSLLVSAVEHHNGRVFGDTGDGLAAVFPSATDAGGAALEMRDRAAQTHRGDQPPIHLRIGVHHGEVIPNGDGLIGMSVHLTARLCDLAPRDHIAASDAFARAVADDDHLRLVNFERRVVKGLAEPINVHLVTTDDDLDDLPPTDGLDDVASIPSTPWLDERAGPRTFVGREQLIDSLLDLAATSEHRLQLALVHGEPGIGKSTLLHRIGRQLVATGHLGVVGRADEHHHGAYREIIEMLSHLVKNAPEALLVDHTLHHGNVLARLIPGLHHRIPAIALEGDDREPDRFRLFEAITDLLQSIASHQPLVLLIEDIHWSSPPSLELLRHLVRSVDTTRVFVLASYRTAERSTNAALGSFLAELAREPNARRFRVGPLEPSDVEALVSDAADHRATPQATVRPDAEQLRQRTAGSPLFITEMLKSYEEAGETTRLDDGSLAIPDTVQELATLRVDRLGPRHRSVLSDAAVLGVSFTVADIEALAATDQNGVDTGVGAVSVLDVLEEAEQAGILEPDPSDEGRSLAFHHAVIRDALYEATSPIRRRRRHGAAADVIVANAGDELELCAAVAIRHIELAGGDCSTALMIRLAEAAADHAASRLSLQDAIRFRHMAVDAHRRASDRPDASASVAEALLRLAAAQTAAGMAEGEATHVEAAAVARAADRWDLFSEAAAGYGGELKENQATADNSRPVALITEALRHEREPTAMRAQLLSSLAIWQRQYVPYTERRALVDEALDIARSLGEPRTLARVLAEFHRALHGPNVTNLAWEMSDELERLAAELADDNVALQALNLRLLAAFELGYSNACDRVTEQLDRIAGRIGNIEGRRIALLWRGTAAGLRGDRNEVQAAVADLDRLIAAYPEDQRMVMLGALNIVLPWFAGQSNVLYEFAKPFAPPGTLALFAADAGRLDDAVQHVAERGGPASIEQDQNYLFFLDLVAMTRVAVRTNDASMASALYDIGVRYERRNARMGLVAFLGAVDHHLGSLASVIGRWDDAVHHYQVALARHDRMGAQPFLALTSAELAIALETERSASMSSADTVARHRERARSIADELDLALVHELL